MYPRLFTLPAFTAFGRELGPFTLHTYGVLLAVAFLVGLWVAYWQAKRAGLDAGRIADMAVYVLIAGLIGARLMLLAVDYKYYANNPRELVSMLQSGGVFYGGSWRPGRGPLFRAALRPARLGHRGRARARCRHRPEHRPPRLPGRGLLWGRPADVPWAVTFTDEYTRYVGTPLDVRLHPSQIYESLATFLIFAVLVWIAPRKQFHGQVLITYVVLYSTARFVLEYFRGDAGRGFIGPLSTSQAMAIVLVLAGALFVKLRRTQATAPAAA